MPPAAGVSDMQVIGHRGCPDHFPENTVAAVRGAAPHVDAVEVDVRRCGSGELVVFHDDRLDRLTAATGAVHEWGYDDLSALSVEGSGEPIPTLADVVDAVPDGVSVNIELKHAGMAEEVLSLQSEFEGDVLVSSFETAAIAPFQNEDVPTAYLCADSFSLTIADELDCAAIHPQYGLVDEGRVVRAHEQGIAVNAWTVPTKDIVQKLRSDGVDGVIVDSWTVVAD